MYVNLQRFICVYIHIYMCIHMYIYICIYMIHISVRFHIYYIYILSHIYTYIPIFLCRMFHIYMKFRTMCLNNLVTSKQVQVRVLSCQAL